MVEKKLSIATFGGGCFWCTEAIFLRVKGVKKVTSGYAGGDLPSPTYEDVSSGASGHAEAIQIEFDPSIVSYSHLLEIFFATHDPTQLNRQGNDIGTQYRSVVFYHNSAQKDEVKATIEKMAKSGEYNNKKIVTQVVPFKDFYTAESYHQNYYANNKDENPYCSIVIDPKIQKLLRKFSSDVKKEYVPK